MGSLFSRHNDQDIFPLMVEQNLSAMRKMLSQHPSAANAMDPDTAGTPLHRAAYNGWSEGVKELLKAGGDASREDLTYGALPLHLALTKNHPSVIELLIPATKSLCHRNKHEYTPLMIAVENFRERWVRELLAKGGMHDTGQRDIPILAWACVKWELLLTPEKQRAAAEITDALVRKGAAVDEPDPSGWTPLMFAGLFGQSNVVAALLKAGADKTRQNSDGMTATDLCRKSNETADYPCFAETLSLLEG